MKNRIVMEICCRAQDIPAFKKLGFEVDPGQGMFHLKIDLRKWYETDQKALLAAGIPYFGSHEAGGGSRTGERPLIPSAYQTNPDEAAQIHASLVASDGKAVAPASHVSCYEHGICTAAEYNNYPVVRILRGGGFSEDDLAQAREFWKVRKRAEQLIGLVITTEDDEDGRAVWPEGFTFEENQQPKI